ncbi:MAG TPA: SBBP repeat-containing protein [Acidimicrobiales bacterium]|nr:SBBP repeat-containing protein [Acidimicrobiales bacterium]
MTTRLRPLVLLTTVGLALSGSQILGGAGGSGSADAARHSTLRSSGARPTERPEANFVRLPLRFEANEGQVDPQVKFVARGPRSNLFLTAGEAVLALSEPIDASRPPSVMRLSLVGAKPDPKVVGLDPLPGTSNYLRGGDPARWRTGVSGYGRVAYQGAYPGIDLVYHGRNGSLEYDFVVSPGADPQAITIALEGHRGLRLDGDGSLVADMGTKKVRQPKPFAYQLVGGARRAVAARYHLGPRGRVRFTLGAYDPSRPLVIDPVIEYSTYLGGAQHDFGKAVAVDAAGNAYVVGNTSSADFPTRGSTRTYAGAGSGGWGGDAFVAKLDPTGSSLVYATYFGGTKDDAADDVGIDAAGHAYVIGGTGSSDFPTTAGALQGTPMGCNLAFKDAYPCDVFVAKLSPVGDSLVYSTLLGGANGDIPGGIAVGTGGKAYLTGSTASRDFPTTEGAFDRACGTTGDCDAVEFTDSTGKVLDPAWDAFVTVLDAGGAALTYSTYLGGPRTSSNLRKEGANDIAVDAAGHIFVTGYTESAVFPVTPGATQAACASCMGDAFISRINPAGQGLLDLVYSSYLGGKLYPQGGESISLWSDGPLGQTYAYVAGWTWASDFPTTPNALQPRKIDPFYLEGFMVRVVTTSASVAPPDYSTYVGGLGRDFVRGIAVDDAGGAHLAGDTESNDFPITPDAFQPSKRSGAPVGFLLRVDPALPGPLSLVYSTFLGDGEGMGEAAQGVTVDSAGNPFVTGYTANFGFPVSRGAFQTQLRGPSGADSKPDAFLLKLNFDGVFKNYADLAVGVTDSPDPVGMGQDLTYAVSVTNAGPSVADNVVVTDHLPPGVTYKSSLGNCTHSAGAVTCSLGRLAKGETFQPSIVVTPTETGTLTNTVSVQTSSNDPDAANNTAATSTTVQPAADLSLSLADSPDPVVVRQRLTYTLGVANHGPSAATGVTITQLLPAGVNFVSANTTQGSCTRSKQKVTCLIGGVAKDGGATITVVVKPGDKGTIATSASVAGNEIDPSTGNNSATATTTVTG